MKKYIKGLFEVETNTIVTTDIEPALLIDHVSRIESDLSHLYEIFDITELGRYREGTTIKRYATTVSTPAAQVPEGDVIGLTKVQKKALPDVVITLKKYRKMTTAEAIARSGRVNAIDRTDRALVEELESGVITDFATAVNAGTGTADAGEDLQAAVASVCGELETKFAHKRGRKIFFLHPKTVYDYLGTANITMQTMFGLNYLENFLGMGGAIVDPAFPENVVTGTIVENLNGATIDFDDGSLGELFDLTTDEAGVIGMTHGRVLDRASVETLLMTGIVFYPEDLTGVFKANIGA